MSKKPKEITFARPVLASELLSEEAKRNFDNLPAWQRHMIKRIIDHGDMERAAHEAGVARYVKKHVDAEALERETIIDALNRGGLTPKNLVDHLQDCLEAEMMITDKHGNKSYCRDMKLKLKTVELICRLRGDFDKEQKDPNDKKGIVEMFDDTPTE